MKVLITCAAICLLGVSLVACSTGRDALNLSPWENIDEPFGMFPPNKDMINYSAQSISYYFGTGKDKMLADPSVTLKQIAYFEWLVNSLKLNYQLSAQKMKKVIEARVELRKALKIPLDASSNKVVNQLYSTAKVIAATKTNAPYEEPEIAERREILENLKGKISNLLSQAIEEQELANQNGEENKAASQ